MKRNEFIKTSLTLGAGFSLLGCANEEPSTQNIDHNWNSGDVAHILPTVNHNRMLISASFKRAVKKPVLKVGQKSVGGTMRDSEGEFWIFDCTDLEPNSTYDLRLYEGSSPLCDTWPLKTFPLPSTDVSQLKLMIYTCAGGHPISRDYRPLLKETKEQFITRRISLLKRGLSFQPDAIIAIGDQIYWDLEEVLPGIPGDGANEHSYRVAGKFDKSIPILGTPNEQVLKKAIGPQVAELYGTLCRSTPIFMFNDDHDYFENDKATPESITFPPRSFNVKLARIAQGMYWPEFLPDENRPIGLSGSNAADKAQYSSECFGTLRYGRLAEFLMYDCRRFTTLKGPSAGFIPRDAEQWIIDRSASKDTKYTINIPSLPVGWSAGKWMEWYPDVLDKEGILTDQAEKYFWQKGWQNQHDRILSHLTNQSHKMPIFMQGDLHTFAAGKIYRNGHNSYDKNPINAFVMGTLGSTAWPSGIRQVKASAPTAIGIEEYFENVEESGFSIVNLKADNIKIQMYKFLSERDDMAMIENLAAFKELTVGA